MKLIDAIEQVLLSFSSNRFKTIMSCVGIIIGVIAIVVMLSVGQGIREGMSDAFGDLNLDVITIFPGGSGFEAGKIVYQKPAEFDDKDIHALVNTVGVKRVSPRHGSMVTMKFREEERSFYFNAISPTDEPDLLESIDKGRFLMDSDKSALVIGNDIANEMFKFPLNPGMRLTIINEDKDTSKEFTIVGILKEKEQTSPFGGNSNMEMFTTHQALKEFLDIKKYTYSLMLVTVEDRNDIEITAKKVDDNLRKLHKDEGYTVQILKSFLESLDKFFVILKYGLGGIGAVSLAVGGVGIVNVMMLTVTERIKEIGVMKAVGATRSNIRVLFLLESGLLGAVSGLIGITIGSGISFLISSLGNFPIAVTWTSLAAGLMFSIITTTIAGVYPANKASKLDPVEALRAE